MNRGQLIAILIGVFAAGGLVLTALGSDSGESTTVAALPSDDSATDSATSGEAGGEADSAESASAADDVASTDDAPAVPAPENLGPAGTLTDLDGWLQTDATQFEDFDGQVKIVQFWTFGCINCKNTLDQVAFLYETYQPDGLEVIGVHTPEFDFEKDPDSIAAAAIDLNVSWPIALDTRKTNFRSWQEGRRFWPRTYVVDANGDIRYDHIGEFGGSSYDELEATVSYLVNNGGA